MKRQVESVCRWVREHVTATTFLGRALILALFAAHIFRWSRIEIDTPALILLAMLFVFPLLGPLSEFKIPGIFEGKIAPKEIRDAQLKAEAELSKDDGDAATDAARRDFYSDIAMLAQSDPTLALAKWRIEMERLLKARYEQTPSKISRRGALSPGRLLDELVRSDSIPTYIAASVRDVLPLANRAIHGERIRLEDAETLVGLGIKLLHEVRDIFVDQVLKPVSSKEISEVELESFRSSRYRVTTVIPLVEKPRQNVYELNQDGLNSLLEGYAEYPPA